MSGLLIVPSARLIAAELQGDFGRIPSCLIPFGGTPALHRIVEDVRGFDIRVVVACHENHSLVADFVKHMSGDLVQSMDVGPTSSIGETVHRVLATRDEPDGRLVVNFGDTLVQERIPEGDSFFYACPEELFRWTTFRLGSDGYLDEILDKDIEKGDHVAAKVFVGVFSFKSAKRFGTCLRAALADPSPRLDPFYRAVLAYFNSAPRPPTAEEVALWIDLGHLDTYYASRRIHAMGQRAFNAVSIDASRGILTKKSRNEPKFADEIQWYTRIPVGLSYLAPRVFQYSLNPGEMFIDLEFYGYPPLSEVFLFSRLDLTEWQAIFHRLAQVMQDLGAHRAPPTDSFRIEPSLREMYVVKTLERLEEAMDSGLDPWLVDGPLSVNGKPCVPLRQLISAMPEALRSAGLLMSPHFSVIHGDFCLSNILFDRRSRAIRLVDPRGRFGDFHIFGDPRYDLAKLSHCFVGGYDFLVHGLFTLESPGAGTYFLKTFMNEQHVRVQSAFERRFLGDSQLYKQIRAIEALLFLSMVPLHADRPLSQKAFLIRGLETATRFLLASPGVLN